MKIKEYITKKLLVRLAVFLTLTGTALVLDAYFEKNPADIDRIQTQADEHNPEQGEVYILAQGSPFSLKTSVQKTPSRKIHVEKHTRFLRDYYSNRNNHVLKDEVIKQTTPLIASYHFLVFQTHLFSPDEDPLA